MHIAYHHLKCQPTPQSSQPPSPNQYKPHCKHTTANNTQRTTRARLLCSKGCPFQEGTKNTDLSEIPNKATKKKKEHGRPNYNWNFHMTADSKATPFFQPHTTHSHTRAHHHIALCCIWFCVVLCVCSIGCLHSVLLCVKKENAVHNNAFDRSSQRKRYQTIQRHHHQHHRSRFTIILAPKISITLESVLLTINVHPAHASLILQ